MLDKKESVEDYLEHILMLKERQEIVRAIDVARLMNFSKASVSIALKKMKTDGLVTVEANGNLVLTEKGLEIGSVTYAKHKILTELLEKIGVSSEQAHLDACRVEHVISDETFNALKKYSNNK